MIVLKEAECCALAGTDCRPPPLRRWASRPQLKRDPLGGADPTLVSILIFVPPLAIGAMASIWLYGWPWRERDEAPLSRYRMVRASALACGALGVLAFFTRQHWAAHLSTTQTQGLFFSLILTIVALLYALVPPKDDL